MGIERSKEGEKRVIEIRKRDSEERNRITRVKRYIVS
jgi:hypothetical protein